MSDNPYNKPGPTDQPKFNIPEFDMEGVKASVNQAQEALRNPQGYEAQQVVEKSKSFYERNQKVILASVAVIVVLKVNKRKVAKATAKAVAKELGKVQTNGSDLPNMAEILQWLKSTPGMGYIAHGGQWVHLLGRNDTIITIFGDFDNMADHEVFQYTTKVLAS